MIFKDLPKKLLGSEYYMEFESKDIRLGVSKANDFIETLGDASLSLIYCDKKEHSNTTDTMLLNIIRRTHIRHAIIDLNNCFDILLQVPWFHYRIWNEYNTGGLYCNSKKHKPKDDIIRNGDKWINKVENSCNYNKTIEYLKGSNETNLNMLGDKYGLFNETFRFNSSKNVVVREIANQLKHKHNIKLKEFNEPYDFNIKDANGMVVNIRKNNLEVDVKTKFYKETSKKVCGEIVLNYKDDLMVDIEYISGEKFRGKDLLNNDILYSIDDLLNEMTEYRNKIIELYDEVYAVIKEDILINPLMKEPTINKTTGYNVDSFFKQGN
jgi:hypothetical protein